MHDFHFVMDQEMRNRLSHTGAYIHTKSVSGSSRRILRLLAPVIKREHEWGRQRKSKYHHVRKSDSRIVSGIHIYISESDYREMKMLHHNLNFFSIAQLVRFLIEVYLELHSVYGDKLEAVLTELFREWEAMKKSQKVGYSEALRQLLKFYMAMPSNRRTLILYDCHFVPFRILRL